jgi:hypothetical protein
MASEKAGTKRQTVKPLYTRNSGQSPAEEARYYILLSRDLGYHHHETLAGALDEIARLLAAYTKALNRTGF